MPLRFRLQYRVVEPARHQRGHAGVIRLTAQDQVKPVVGAETKIRNEHVRRFVRNQMFRFVEVSRFFDAISSSLEQAHGSRPIGRIRIDDQRRMLNVHVACVFEETSCRGCTSAAKSVSSNNGDAS
jgi:hypothetical protein